MSTKLPLVVPETLYRCPVCSREYLGESNPTAAQKIIQAEAHSRLNDVRSVWSAEKPEQSGWWWLSDPEFEGPTVRRVVARSGKLRVWLPLDQVWMAIDGTPPHWRWAGPLPEPVEPAHNFS